MSIYELQYRFESNASVRPNDYNRIESRGKKRKISFRCFVEFRLKLDQTVLAVEYNHQEIRARFMLMNMSPRPDHWRMEMKKDESSAASQYLFDPPPVEGINGDSERRHVQLVIFVDKVVPSWMAYIIGSGGYVGFIFTLIHITTI